MPVQYVLKFNLRLVPWLIDGKVYWQTGNIVTLNGSQITNHNITSSKQASNPAGNILGNAGWDGDRHILSIGTPKFVLSPHFIFPP